MKSSISLWLYHKIENKKTIPPIIMRYNISSGNIYNEINDREIAFEIQLKEDLDVWLTREAPVF